MSISVKSKKAKARKLQNWAAKKISEVTGFSVQKDGDIEGRSMGQSGVDVILRGKAKEKFPFAVETKWQENTSLYKWLKQVKDNQGDFKYWLLIHKKNNSKPVAIMDASDFFTIYKDLLETGFDIKKEKL